jgi:hypothetical protein
MSAAYEPNVGQALLSCRVILVAVSAAAIHSRYMKGELDVSFIRKMPSVVCRIDRTRPVQLHHSFRGTWNPLRRQPVDFVDFSGDPTPAVKRLKDILTRREFRCTHSIIA